ncbi:MAG: hypothetical protein HQL56_14565 [Magnetococcales bacterium]|nr:hypothetical protein [Magnetococcales bacterium]
MARSEGTVRVACASQGPGLLDGHFGSCSRFLVFDVGPGELVAVEERRIEGPDKGEAATLRRLEALRDCRMVWVAGIGGPPAARLVRAGILPVRFAGAPALQELLDNLKAVLSDRPPPWLAKAMAAH